MKVLVLASDEKDGGDFIFRAKQSKQTVCPSATESVFHVMSRTAKVSAGTRHILPSPPLRTRIYFCFLFFDVV